MARRAEWCSRGMRHWPGRRPAHAAVLGSILVWLPLAAGQTAPPSAEPPPSPAVDAKIRAELQALAARFGETLPAWMEANAAAAPDTPPPAETPAQRPPLPAAVASEADPQGEVHADVTGLLDVHLRNVDIAALLEMISYEARANIVSTTSVSGTITVNLYGVTLEQALHAILTPSGFAFTQLDNAIFVGTPEELAALQPAGPAPARELRVFRLQYISPQEALAAVSAVLSENGRAVAGGAQDEGAGGSDFPASGVDYLIATDYSQNLEAAQQLLRQIDERPRQVLIEATILRATLNETNELGVDFTMLGGVDFQDVNSTSHASADLTTGLLPSDDLQSTTFNVNTDFAGNVAGGGLTFGIIKDSIAGFIRALEDVTDTVVVANPKILALNKQEGEVIVGRRDGYLTTTVTETAAVQTVEFLETGTQIRFRPIINDDGTIRLIIHPKDSNGGLTDAQLPFEETTETNTDILMDDGDTILIGGLFRERTVRSRSQIPLLGDIPLAGQLFGSESDQTLREEVIILLTVHVLTNSPAEDAAFRSLLDDAERIRIGTRRGLMGTGRERLAQVFFHDALDRLDAGREDSALLLLRMTLHNQPRYLPAVKLEEQLLGRRVTELEAMRMRGFVRELIALPAGAGGRAHRALSGADPHASGVRP